MSTPSYLLSQILRDGALYLDNSFMEGLTTCPRAVQYSRINKRIKASRSAALNFGSAIHLALEHRYKTYANIQPDPLLLEQQIEVLQKHFADNPPEEGDYRHLNWAIEIIRRYNDRYAIEQFQLLQNEKGEVLVELPFALPLFTGECLGQKIPVIYTGRIDLPIHIDGQLFVLDHKTTSMLGSQFSLGVQMSAQQRGYAWAMQQLTQEEVRGYVINAIRVKEPPAYLTDPDSKRKGKLTAETWWQESLVRERVYILPGMLDEWKRNTIALVNELFHHLSSDYMPMKTAWCNKYGACQYCEVCQLGQDDRGIMLSSGLFADNHWDPLKDPVQPLLG